MPTAEIGRIKDALKKLVALGEEMLIDLQTRNWGAKNREEHKDLLEKIKGSFEKRYQSWYTEAYATIKQLLPDRLSEFEGYYQPDPKRKALNLLTFSIQDWLVGLRAGEDIYGKKVFNDLAAAATRFGTQVQILEAASARFDSALLEIRQLVEADLFDSEIDSARELLRNGFSRGAGAIGGVVLEKHLREVCANHGAPVHKKSPPISDFNDALKTAGTIDVPIWRLIQRLGDIRNLCAHKKEREPTPEEVSELLDGVNKITKSLF